MHSPDAVVNECIFHEHTFSISGRMKNASTLDQVNKQVAIEFTAEEKLLVESVRDIWEAILNHDIEEDTDFFALGAGSMDVVR